MLGEKLYLKIQFSIISEFPTDISITPFFPSLESCVLLLKLEFLISILLDPSKEIVPAIPKYYINYYYNISSINIQL